MQTYYHNTTPTNPDNTILGYVSNDGDFLTLAEVKEKPPFALADVGIYPVIKIVVESGLLTAGEYYEQFCQRVAKLAFDAVKK